MSRSSPGKRRNLILAVIIAAVGVSAGVLKYLYQDRTAQGEAENGNPDMAQASPDAKPDAMHRSPDTAPVNATLAQSGNDSITPDAGPTRTEGDADTPAPVSLAVENAISTIAVQSATVEEVLEALREGFAIEIIDLRSTNALDAEDEQPRRLSFSFSGTVDETLRFVMEQFEYSYAISYQAPKVNSDQPSIAKLFVYGSPQTTETDEVDAAVTGRTGAAEPPTSAAAGLRVEEKPTVAEVLRSRALHSGQTLPRTTGVQGGTGKPGVVPSADVGDVPYASEEDKLNAQLSDMTRKARRDVEALVEGLKQVEDSLKAAQGNAP